MSLIKCPDCGKEVSDMASNCIGCGRPMEKSTDNKITVVERKGGKYELFGALMVLASMGGCTIGMATTNMSGGWFGAGAIGFLVGIGIFIYGRFF